MLNSELYCMTMLLFHVYHISYHFANEHSLFQYLLTNVVFVLISFQVVFSEDGTLFRNYA